MQAMVRTRIKALENMNTITPELREKVKAAVATLSEHFDSVRIFVTLHNGGESETASYETGGGNFYAQLGQVQEWLCIQEQFQKNYAIKKDKEDENEQ